MNEFMAHIPPGEKLADNDELLHRNVRADFVQGEIVSKQAFEPGPLDEGLLSLDREKLSTPREAFERFLGTHGVASGGILSITAGECEAHQVPALENPIRENPAHAVADFRQHNNNQTKKRSGILRDLAFARGWQLRPKTDH